MLKSLANVKLTKALESVDDIFVESDRAREKWDGPTSQSPTTAIAYAEALHIVQRREDEKRRRESKHDPKSKKKGGQEQVHLPGSRPGVDPEVSAFWMVMDVRSRAGCTDVCEAHSL
jgi:hypothetical protein